MSMERLESCSSREECLERVAAAASRREPGAWVLGVGVRAEGWREPRWPTAAELDDAEGDRPVCLWSFDHHALVVNSAAMRAVGISEATPDPEHGRIVRDERGRPAGLMLEAAAKQVWSRIPEPTPPERRELVRAALADLASHGFDEVHDLLAPLWLGPLLAELHDAGDLAIRRILLYVRPEDFDAAVATRPRWERPGLRLGGMKLFADGTLNSRTAWMLHPYADPLPGLPRGEAMLTRDRLAVQIRRTRDAGVGLAVHAIGDAAVRESLDAWELCAPPPRHSVAPSLPPFRIEHAELIDEADVPRFAALGVVCSIQPCHLLADIEALTRGLPHRLHRVLPLRELIDAGCRPGEQLWFGSDTPIVRPHPEDSLQAAVHRRRIGADPSSAIAPTQAITEAEARACFGEASVSRRRA
jgi:predicted amidohydrolase YtcJ